MGRKQGNGVAAANANDDAGGSSSSSSFPCTPRRGDWRGGWLGGYGGRKKGAVGPICVVFACDRELEEASIARRALDAGATSHRESESLESTSLLGIHFRCPCLFWGVIICGLGSSAVWLSGQSQLARAREGGGLGANGVEWA